MHYTGLWLQEKLLGAIVQNLVQIIEMVITSTAFTDDCAGNKGWILEFQNGRV
jgi:hypothetical protein